MGVANHPQKKGFWNWDLKWSPGWLVGWLVARLPPDNMDNKITVEMGIYPPNMFVGAEETITRPSHMSFRADSGSNTLDIHQLLDHAEAKAVIFLMRLAAVAFGFHH